MARAPWMVLLLMLPVEGTAQGWEIDWEAVGQVGATLAERASALPINEHLEALASSYEVDWELTGRLVDRVLREQSWEHAAALLPYAEQAAVHLKRVAGGDAAGAWLQQRLEYLRIADVYVRGPAPPPSPPTSRPPARTVPRPVATLPAPVHQVQMDKDMQMWLKRLPAEPSAYARQMEPTLKQIFEHEGVPGALIWLAEVESSFNPKALSPAGAAGLYQFMPATAGRFGLALEPDDQRLNPELSAQAAACYLRLLHRRFSDWPLALAAYNAGEGRVGRALRQRQGKAFEEIAGHLPLETRMYVPRIAAVVQHREGVDLRTLPAPK